MAEERTQNEELFDAQIRHQIYLLLLAQGISVRAIEVLNDTEEALAARIRSAFKGKASLASRADVARVNKLLSTLSRTRERAWIEVRDILVGEVVDATLEEPKTLAGFLKLFSPLVLSLALPPRSTLRSIVRNGAFEGRTLREWIEKLAQDDFARIAAQVRAGAVAGETGDTIARRVVGAARASGTDGATEITRRQTAAVTNTAVIFATEEAQREFSMLNEESLGRELFVAVLDSRTTPICRSLDGKRYRVGTGPQPPLHMRCRSRRVLLLPGQPDPRPQTYHEWLMAQPAAFQDEILGKARGKLFRNGAMDLEQFVTPKGKTVTLEELAEAHAREFRRAGLNPEDFE